MDLTTIDAQHDDYVAFLTSVGKSEHIREIDLDDFSDFLTAMNAWNTAHADKKVCKIGVYNTFRTLDDGEELINAYLVGLDSDGVLVTGGGGTTLGPPHCCPS
jgi:hypothetical protein